MRGPVRKVQRQVSALRLRRLALVVATVAAVAAGEAPAGAAGDTLRVAVFGDSQMEGQGNVTERKFTRVYARALAERTRKRVVVHDFAHSGSTLTYRHAGTDEVTGGGSCAEGFATPIEVPAVSPAIVECQIPRAAALHKTVDLVVLNGCANDVGALPTPGYREQSNMLTGTLPIAEGIERYCAAALRDAIQSAHELPGAPRVAVIGFYPVISDESLGNRRLRRLAPALGLDDKGSLAAAISYAARRMAEFTSLYGGEVAEIVKELGARRWATFVSPGFTEANAMFAPRDRFWHGFDDPLLARRTRQCLPYLELFPLCPIASIGHPDVLGSLRIGEAMTRNRALRRWFPRRGR